MAYMLNYDLSKQMMHEDDEELQAEVLEGIKFMKLKGSANAAKNYADKRQAEIQARDNERQKIRKTAYKIAKGAGVKVGKRPGSNVGLVESMLKVDKQKDAQLRKQAKELAQLRKQLGVPPKKQASKQAKKK